MIAHPTLPLRARGAALIALAMLALVAVLMPGTAAASPGSGEVALSFKSDAKGSLSKQGVKVTYSAKTGKTGSAKRAGGPAQIASLPVSQLDLGAAAKVRTKGSLTLTANGRTASLSNVILQVGAKSTAIAAKLGGEQLTFFQAKGKPQIDASSVKLNGAALSLTGPGAKALRESLGLASLSPSRVGTASVDAALLVTVQKPSEPAPEQKQADDGSPQPSPDPDPKPDPNPNYPYATQCPVGDVSGGPGFGNAPGAIAGIAASPTFNPGTSQSVAGSAIDWGFKTSFRNYVLNVGAAGSLQTLDGAGATPAGATMAAAGSFFDFPVADGTYEPGSAPDHSDDRLVASGGGTVLFCKAGHGFSVVMKDPTITLDGASSRITADVGVNFKGTWYGFQRADIATLDLSGVEPQLSDGGTTLVWEDIPAKLSADGFAATGELYPIGETLDPITVETSLQRPLLTQCTIDAGAGAPPAVDFTQAALPTLNDPVTGTGGTIDWGFRRALRNTVVLPVPGGGSFQLLGGASEGYPGNMGGGNSAAPAGGLGKFFRFPVASYAYEEGVAGDPSDDRLIATSNATVGFCNPNAGGFGVILSKPTLVIDGANSRLIANAYSYASPGKGWIGGRVDLVDLDTSAVGATPGLNSVRWGDVPADNTPMSSGIPVAGGLQTEALSLAGLTVAGTASGGFDPVSARIQLPAEADPFAAECPVPFVEGSAGFGDVPGEVSGLAPTPIFNSGTEQSVAGSSIEWGFKDSFRSYVGNVPPAGSMLGLGGAVATPNGTSMALPGSFFDFPGDGGTYEAGTAPDHSDDKLVVEGSGTALFCKAGHGFSVALKNPALVIDGADSRIVADVGVNQNGTWYGFQRADIAELDLSGVEPQVSDGGNTLVWEDIPATLSADGDLASGLYPAGETLDPITVRTSLQRPMLTQCAIDAGAGTPPAVDFTRAALPTLSDPVTGSGGTINWGFRRATRNTVTLPVPGGGSFQLAGGASESYPGNMGGSASAPPTGGLGKFFRFPVASYEYEEGEAANPNDDRLVATSNATVGFCIPNAGSFGLVISKPTLVIDGANSRIVANAYSYRSPNMGWIGGRVDLVDLDTSAVGAVGGSGTVSWGEVNPNETPLNSGIPVAGGLQTEALSLASLTIASTASGGFDPVAAQIELPSP